MDDNDGRKPAAWLPELVITGTPNAVVQMVEEKTGEILYTVRTPGARWQPPVFAPGKYTVRTGGATSRTGPGLRASRRSPKPRRQENGTSPFENPGALLRR